MYATMVDGFNPTKEQITAGAKPSWGPNFAKVWGAAAQADKDTFLAKLNTDFSTSMRDKIGYLFESGIVTKSAEKMFDVTTGNMLVLAGAAMKLMVELEAINPMVTILPNLVY